MKTDHAIEKRPERSQQWLWQQRMKAQGRCPKCGGVPKEGRTCCELCLLKKQVWRKKKKSLDKTNSAAKMRTPKGRRGVIPSKGVKNSGRVKR